MLGIVKQNAALIKKIGERKNIKPILLENMDETDLFFLSMSKTTKQLPKVVQAKIKLLLSTFVLRAEIRNTSIQAASTPVPSPVPSEAPTVSSTYTLIPSEEKVKRTVNVFQNLNM